MRLVVISILLLPGLFLASCMVLPSTPTSTPTQTAAQTATFTQTTTVTPSPTPTPIPTVSPELVAQMEQLGLTFEFNPTSQMWVLFDEQGQLVGKFADGDAGQDVIIDEAGDILYIKDGESWVTPVQREINKQIEGFGYDPSLYRVNGDRLEYAQTGERLGEIREGNEVVIYEVMTKVSYEAMLSNFEAVSGMTIEEAKANQLLEEDSLPDTF